LSFSSGITRNVHFWLNSGPRLRFPLSFLSPSHRKPSVSISAPLIVRDFVNSFSFFPVIFYLPSNCLLFLKNLYCWGCPFISCRCFQSDLKTKLVGFMFCTWLTLRKYLIHHFYRFFGTLPSCIDQIMTKKKWSDPLQVDLVGQ